MQIMKLSKQGTVTAAFITLAGLLASAQVQSQPAQQPPDSVVAVVADAMSLPFVAPDERPAFGTFWEVRSSLPCITAPLPFPPLDPNTPVYAIGDPVSGGQFLVDETAGRVTSSQEQYTGGTLSTMDSAAILQAQADELQNFVAQTQARQAQAQLRANAQLSDFTLDDEDGELLGPMSLNSYTSDDLWLEILTVTNSTGFFIVHPPEAEVATGAYDLFMTTNLSTDVSDLNLTNWLHLLRTVPGQTNLIVPDLWADQAYFRLGRTNDTDEDGMSDAYEHLVSHTNPTNADENDNGIPDGWEWSYFGSLQAGDSDYDGDGVTNYQEYLNGTDPNKIQFRLSVTNQLVNSSLVPVSLAVAGGVPSAVAILLDSTNYSAATWAAFSSSLAVNIGTAEGWHDVWVGLRGRLDTSQQTWEWVRIKLDETPPVLVLTSPTSTNGSQPLIQLKGHSSEALARISYDITNTAGLITNQQVLITSQTPGTNAWEFTTTDFQAFDVLLTSGLNALTLHATDLAGNTVAISTNFTVDFSNATNPPLVQIEWPQPGTKVSGTNFICNGWVDDPTATVVAKMVTTNGTTNAFTALVGRNGAFWIENLPLKSGTNLWTLCITNAAGHATVTNLSVIQSPLTLTLNTVTPDSQLWQSHVSVTGSISDAAYAVWVNGIKATNNGDGTWSAPDVPVTEGGAAIFDVTAYSPTEQQPDGSYGN
jgi:hypothetical protein